jgi:hypothetical protein
MLELLRPRSAPSLARFAALTVPLILAACDRSPADPSGVFGLLAFSKQIDLPTTKTILAAGPTRVRIDVIPGTLTARKVVIKEGEQLTRPERIVSRVTGVAVAGTTAGDDTLLLELGKIRVVVTSTTVFRGEVEDEPVPPGTSESEFVARLQALLAAGRHPAVEARRKAPAQPQAPGDTSFVAQEVRLDDAADRPRIEMNVAAANLLMNSGTPPPDAWLEVLNRKIELRVSDGTTRIVQEGPRTTGEIHFAGVVKSVDPTAKTATLMDGTVLRIVAGTEFEVGEGPDGQAEDGPGDRDDGTLGSLPAVQTALAAGKTVVARGEALLETTSPRTLDVIEVGFQIQEMDASPMLGP